MMKSTLDRSRYGAGSTIFGQVSRGLGVVLVLVMSVWGAACVGEARAQSPLANTFRSPEALVEAVLEALEAKDEEALRSFLITRQEYEAVLWPEMPDGQHTPFDFFWGMAFKGQKKGLSQLLTTYGGLDLELVSITLPTDENDLERYDSFTYHKRVEVVVRRRDTGDEGELPSFDVFLEHDGVWKLANYDEL